MEDNKREPAAALPVRFIRAAWMDIVSDGTAKAPFADSYPPALGKIYYQVPIELIAVLIKTAVAVNHLSSGLFTHIQLL